MIKFLTIFSLIAHFPGIQKEPVSIENNPNKKLSIVNSVDFDPYENRCCVTYSLNNKVAIYQLDESGRLILTDQLENIPSPQHALFSRDGKRVIVVSWLRGDFTIFQKENSFHFNKTPIKKIRCPKKLRRYKPHGMAFSPCGNYLAVAYGASIQHPKAVALYRLEDCDLTLIETVSTEKIVAGIPKGITFTPDGTKILVTFAKTDSLALYTFDKENEKIVEEPIQHLTGVHTGLSRPEDVKVSPDGTYIAVSNSSKNSITFYGIDDTIDETPLFTLKNPDANLNFPHGLAFSADGKFLAVTQFGKVSINQTGAIDWGNEERGDRVAIYLLEER